MVILCILFGAFSFSFVVLRSHMAAAVVGNHNNPNEELVVSGALLCIRGLACVGSGYIGAAVKGVDEEVGIRPGYGAGKWRGLIITVGIVMGGATIGAFGFLDVKRQRMATAKIRPGSLSWFRRQQQSNG
jgi:hypothetical protein